MMSGSPCTCSGTSRDRWRTARHSAPASRSTSRFVGREVTLVLLGLCVLLSAGGTYLRFEPLLAALAAGLVVENIAPPRGDVLRVAVEEGALPVLVIFFAAAGASLRLDAVAQLGVIAVAISAFRIFSIRTATAVGGRVSGLRPDHRRLVWMGLVSQAGVTLGLAVIVANQYPGWGNASADTRGIDDRHP